MLFSNNSSRKVYLCTYIKAGCVKIPLGLMQTTLYAVVPLFVFLRASLPFLPVAQACSLCPSRPASQKTGNKYKADYRTCFI